MMSEMRREVVQSRQRSRATSKATAKARSKSQPKTSVKAKGKRHMEPVGMSPLLLTVEQAGDMLALSRYAMYKLLGSGRIESIKIGHLRRLSVASLERFVAEQMSA